MQSSTPSLATTGTTAGKTLDERVCMVIAPKVSKKLPILSSLSWLLPSNWAFRVSVDPHRRLELVGAARVTLMRTRDTLSSMQGELVRNH